MYKNLNEASNFSALNIFISQKLTGSTCGKQNLRPASIPIDAIHKREQLQLQTLQILSDEVEIQQALINI
jgi:hypothetical protein